MPRKVVTVYEAVGIKEFKGEHYLNFKATKQVATRNNRMTKRPERTVQTGRVMNYFGTDVVQFNINPDEATILLENLELLRQIAGMRGELPPELA